MQEINNKLKEEIKQSIRQILIQELKNYNKEPIVLPYESLFLKEILFDRDKNNYYHFSNDLEEIYKKISFLNIPFDNVIVIKKDLSKYQDIFINPSTLGKKSLFGTICKNVNFIGNFENVDIKFTNFKGSKNAIINVQRIKNKSLYGTICDGVTFTRGFNHTDIRNTNFTNSKNVRINPEKLKNKSLKGTITKDVEFNGSFIGTDLRGTDFTGSKEANITPINILYNENTNFTSANIINIKTRKREKYE